MTSNTYYSELKDHSVLICSERELRDVLAALPTETLPCYCGCHNWIVPKCIFFLSPYRTEFISTLHVHVHALCSMADVWRL